MIPKFLKKVTLLGMLWVGIVYGICLFLPFHYFNAEYPMWLSKMEKINEHDGHRNFILGDSRAIAGVDPKVLGDTYYNLALGGGTPMEGYFMLKKMIAANKEIDTLIVAYAPLHLEQSEMFWDRQLKYNFYDTADIETIFKQLNSGNENFWTYDDAEFFNENEKLSLLRKAYAIHYKNPMELRAELTKSFLLRGYSNHGVYKEIQDRKGSYDFGTGKFSHDLNVEAQRVRFKPKKILADCLEKIFELAQRNNIQVLCISLPMNDASYRKISKPYQNAVSEFYQRLQHKYPDSFFHQADIVSYEDSFFGDASHLNEKGRKRFSFEIRNYLSGLEGYKKKSLLTSIQ